MAEIPAAQAVTRLGRVSLNPRGEYRGGESYDRLDLVQKDGSGWICLKDGVSSVPGEGAEWSRLADNGGAATVEMAREYADEAKASEAAAKESETAARASEAVSTESAGTAARDAKSAGVRREGRDGGEVAGGNDGEGGDAGGRRRGHGEEGGQGRHL